MAAKGTSSNTNGAAPFIIPLIIDNKPVFSAEKFAVYAPATGAHLHDCSSASISDTEAAIESAQRAFKLWRKASVSSRRDILLRAASLFEERREDLIKHMIEETGATRPWAELNVFTSLGFLKDVAGRISSLNGFVPSVSEGDGAAMVLTEPYGVILGIAPWNAPFSLGVRSILYALATGNTAILKAPEMSPQCSYDIVTIFHGAGLPAGVLNLIAHQPSAAAAITKHLIQDPRVKKINFTGSTMVGRIIAKLAGENLKPVLLELGGKAPAIVLDDADIILAANQCIRGAFFHSGQVCMSTERILVHELIAKEFEAELIKALSLFIPEDGPAPVLINGASVEKNKRLLEDAVSKGANLIAGSVKAYEDRPTKMRPVIVKGTRKDMNLYYIESFGPTVSLIIVKSEEEAVEIANDTEYGLTAAVFTRDLARGMRVADAIESGAVHINGMTIHDEAALPHGGVKASGYGRFGSTGLEEWVRTKTITFKR
ncbi:putative salicylaldehyde dehydrogenase [Xylogone sp. PMI_703]|nr:putative salicylaldehyde dehydrogenase [Xylogone sp. PMI_703]